MAKQEQEVIVQEQEAVALDPMEALRRVREANTALKAARDLMKNTLADVGDVLKPLRNEAAQRYVAAQQELVAARQGLRDVGIGRLTSKVTEAILRGEEVDW